MTFIKFTLIIIGIILLFTMAYQITLYLRPGIFPPKRVVKERIILSGGIGGTFILLGVVFTIFGK